MIDFDQSLKDVLAKMDALPAKIEANLVRAAMNAAAKPMVQEIKNNVPVKSGALRDSVRSSSAINKKKGEVVVKITAGGKGNSKRDAAYYANFIEYGVAKHVIKGPVVLNGRVFRNIQHPGFAARPFMRPAFDSADQKVLVAYGDYMKANMDKVLAKNGLS